MFAWFRRVNPASEIRRSRSRSRGGPASTASLSTRRAGERWSLDEVAFFDGAEPSRWAARIISRARGCPRARGEQWVYVDLGATMHVRPRRVCTGSAARPRARSRSRTTATAWRDIQALPCEQGPLDDLKLAQPGKGRYVRVLMKQARRRPRATSSASSRSSGRAAWCPEADAAAPAETDGSHRSRRRRLARGARFARQGRRRGALADRASTIPTGWSRPSPAPCWSATERRRHPRPELRRQPDDDLRLVLPGRLLVPQRVHGAGRLLRARDVWLNFDGINWKAEVFLNGEKLGGIEGGFMRGRFDVTASWCGRAKNALAVRIVKTATPGSIKEATSRVPTSTAAPSGRTIRPFTLPSDGTGSRPSAAGRPASGTASTSTPPAR